MSLSLSWRWWWWWRWLFYSHLISVSWLFWAPSHRKLCAFPTWFHPKVVFTQTWRHLFDRIELDLNVFLLITVYLLLIIPKQLHSQFHKQLLTNSRVILRQSKNGWTANIEIWISHLNRDVDDREDRASRNSHPDYCAVRKAWIS